MKFKLEIEKERFEPTDLHPLAFGVGRALFEKNKLEKLIAAAESVEGKTARSLAERWRRKLQKIDSSQHKLERLREQLLDGAPLRQSRVAHSVFQTP